MRNSRRTIVALTLGLALAAPACRGRRNDHPFEARLRFTLPWMGELQAAQRTPEGLLLVHEAAPGQPLASLIAADGKEVWRHKADAILLGRTPSDPPIAITRGAEGFRVDAIDRGTGKVVTGFDVRATTGVGDGWDRTGNDLFAIAGEDNTTESTILRIDIKSARVVWQRRAGRVLNLHRWVGHGARAVVVRDAVVLACRDIGTTSGATHLCSFALADGAQRTVPCDSGVSALDSDGEDGVLVRDVVEVRSLGSDLKPHWRLPGGFEAAEVTQNHRLVLLDSDRLVAVDAQTGVIQWERRADRGERFQSVLATADDLVLFESDRQPQLRVLDSTGRLRMGMPMKTRFVVTTEFALNRVEGVVGRVLLDPPWLVFSRETAGVEAYGLE